MLSGTVAYATVSPGNYTATATYTFETGVSAIKVMKSDGTTIIASQAVSSGTAQIVIPYTTADITGAKSFYVVALGNGTVSESTASVSQELYDPLYLPPAIFDSGVVSAAPIKRAEFVADYYNRHLAFDKEGKLWVGGQSNASQYTASGISTGISGPGGGGPVAFDGNGNMWFSDDGNLKKMTMNGTVLVELGNGAYKLNGVVQPNNANANYYFNFNPVALDMQGNVYVLGAYEVKKFTKDGFYISTIITGITGYTKALTVSKDGSVYVVHSHGSHFTKYTPTVVNGVEVYNAVYTISIPGGRSSMTTDRDGNLWATGPTSVFQYSQIDGSLLREINTGQLNNPGGIAISPDGKMYISGPNAKVQIWY